MQVLLKHYWKLNPIIEQAGAGFEYAVAENTAAVIIGDRALEARSRFSFVYDLAEAWKALTGMPFLFAAWVAHHSVPDAILQKLDEAFAFGVSHIAESIAHFNLHVDYYEIAYYLEQNIYYPVGPDQLKAETLFRQYIRDLNK
jgi:chorismate dehydratase